MMYAKVKLLLWIAFLVIRTDLTLGEAQNGWFQNNDQNNNNWGNQQHTSNTQNNAYGDNRGGSGGGGGGRGGGGGDGWPPNNQGGFDPTEQREVKVVGFPRHQELKIGDNLELSCQFSEKVPACIWDHDGRSILVDQYGGNMIPFGDRISGHCGFRVEDINYHYDGIWTCKSPETSALKAANANPVNVTIQLPPESPLLTYGEANNQVRVQFGRPIGGSAGNRIRLTCTSNRGNPAAQISWTSEKGLYQLPRPRQIVQRVDLTEQGRGFSNGFYPMQNDGGTYKKYAWTTLSQIEISLQQNVPSEKILCNVNHPALKEGVENTWVRVMTQHTASEAQILVDGRDKHEDAINMHQNNRTTLTCDSNGWPEPTIEWRFIEKFDGANVQRRGDGSQRNLTITGEEKNVGTYYCRVQSRQSNSLPVESRHVRMYLLGFNAPPPSNGDSGGLSSGEIVGIVIAGIILLALIITVVLYRYNKGEWCYKYKNDTGSRRGYDAARDPMMHQGLSPPHEPKSTAID